MKITGRLFSTFLTFSFTLACLLVLQMGFSQMPPPGYERAMKMKQAQDAMPYLDRDSITVIDTAIIFDPTTYEEETKIISTTYSLREYCKQFLGMNNPDILMDHQPHTIIDPKTYEDMIIRLDPSGKIDTLPK